MDNFSVDRVPSLASAKQVREWAVSQGLAVGKRGKFSPELIKAYNKANPLKYVEGGYVPSITIEGRKNGKKVTRKVNSSAIRQAAISAGVEVKAKGRLSREILSAAVGLTPIEKPVTLSETAKLRAKLIADGVKVGARGRLPKSAT